MTKDKAETLIATLVRTAQAIANAQDWPGAPNDPAYREAVREHDEARDALMAALVRP